MSKESLWKKFEDHILNEGLSDKRKEKLSMVYRIISRYLDLETAKREDIESYINKLNRNQIKKDRPSLDGSVCYSGSTKQDIKKFLKQFFKWYKGNNESYPPEVSWLKTRIAKDEKPKEKPVIELKDIGKLAHGFQKYEYQILTLLLFDSGFRIQEMLSIKKKDLTWAEFDSGKKCFWIKCNVSKTFPRNIPIPLFTSEIDGFMNSAFMKGKNEDDILFDIGYENYLKLLKKNGLKLFKLKLTPHCLRHSSATYYAKEYSGNVPLLAQRYGWSYAAEELQTYVRSSGAYNREGAKISFKNEVVGLKEQNETLKEQMAALNEKMNKLEKALQILVKKKSKFSDLL